MRHWRHAALTSRRDAAASNLERRWTRQSGLARSFEVWWRWLEVRVARRERDTTLAATLQHAAERVACVRAPLADANARGGHICSLHRHGTARCSCEPACFPNCDENERCGSSSKANAQLDPERVRAAVVGRYTAALRRCASCVPVVAAQAAFHAAVQADRGAAAQGGLRFCAGEECVLWAASVRHLAPTAFRFPVFTATPSAARCA
jgi:hypothetical protein